MHLKSLARLFSSAAGLLTLLLFASVATGAKAMAATETVLWSFGNGVDGGMTGTKQFNESVPGILPGLISDSAGNLYGTTPLGGAYGGTFGNGGTVYKLSPPAQAGGIWSESVLYNFGAAASDGLHPWGTVTMDASGNLFGTTTDGGAYGYGTVYELTPPAAPGGKWTEAVLFSFGAPGSAGGHPEGQLLIDGGGNLYGGATALVFELSPPSSPNSAWTETVIAVHSTSSSLQYVELTSGFISDATGNLYGTSFGGGSFNGGTFFESSPPASSGGSWTNTILWSFAGNTVDGSGPRAGLIADSGGNLYGSTALGGAAGRGSVFEFSPSGGGWSESILSAFDGIYKSGTAPSEPDGGVVMNANGNLFGTTTKGGTNSRGTVFALAHPSTPGGSWTQSIVWNFGSTGGSGKTKIDGTSPESHLLVDSNGNLYGTTLTGGAYGRGTIFEVSNTGL